MKTIHANMAEMDAQTQGPYRDEIELLRSRVSLLTGKDKLLMTMYLENHNSFRQIAQLTGVSEARIARKIHRLTKRLLGSEYILCLRHRHRFTKAEMGIARDYYLLGLSRKATAQEHHCSDYQVRKMLRRVQQLLRAEQGGQKLTHGNKRG